MITPFVFDEDVAIEVILYIAHRVFDPTFHRISKIMYFADKTHLERYGRFICGDNYVAMQHGSVPSFTYDILKVRRFEHHPHPIYKKIKSAFRVDEYTVTPLREADSDCLSDSDIECLDEAIEKYGRMSFSELTQNSHDAAWKAVDENDFIEIEHIVNTFENSTALLEHLRDPHPNEIQ